MAGLEDHFGEDASLDEEDAQAILVFLKDNSAETSDFEPAYKISRSIPEGEIPIAITETPYWIKKHKDITPEEFAAPDIRNKANCTACHEDAEYGTYEDHLVNYKGMKEEEEEEDEADD